MDIKYALKNVLSLETPLGSVSVLYRGEAIPFNVRELEHYAYKVYDGEEIVGEIMPTAYFEIRLPVAKLPLGGGYAVLFEGGKLRFFGSGEHTKSYGIQSNGWSLAIGSFDLNEPDVERLETAYTVEPSDGKDGFAFEIIDRSEAEIVFSIAWVRHGEYPDIKYEGAVDLWTT